MNNMPEKIYATKTTTQTGKERWWHEQASLSLGHTTYYRHDLYEALEADNKMLAEALQMMVDKYGGMYDDYQEADIAAKEALAQRIGVK
jgi:hypothetical protein